MQELTIIVGGMVKMAAEWSILVDQKAEYLILKKNALSNEYVFIKSPVGRRGSDTIMEYFSSDTDEHAQIYGIETAKKYRLSINELTEGN